MSVNRRNNRKIPQLTFQNKQNLWVLLLRIELFCFMYRVAHYQVMDRSSFSLTSLNAACITSSAFGKPQPIYTILSCLWLALSIPELFCPSFMPFHLSCPPYFLLVFLVFFCHIFLPL